MDYNDDDYYNGEDNEENSDLFGTHRLQQQLEKDMFLQDVDNNHPLVLDPSEFITLFGPITEDDMNYLTQSFFTQYHRLGVTVDTLFDRWGGDWIFEVLKFCETCEEYEMCSIIKDMWEERKSLSSIKHLINVAE